MSRLLFVMTGFGIGASIVMMLIGLLFVAGGDDNLKIAGAIFFSGFGYAGGTLASVWLEMRQHVRWMKAQTGWFDR